MIEYMPPEINESVNKISYKWNTMDLLISAERITDDGRAELWFYNEDKTNRHLLHIAKVNLLSTTTMNNVARRMKEHQDEIPWQQILTLVSAHTVEYKRHGENVIHLWTSQDVQRPEYLINPLIVKNYPNVIFGDPSSSKSIVAIILYQVLSLPWKENPLNITAPSRSIKCLYLDWETDSATVIWQTTLLERGTDIGILLMDYRQCAAPLVNDIEKINEAINNVQAEVIIIDSLGLAVGGDLNETKPALEFFAGLRELNKTSLILAHNAKERLSRTRSIYGNQYYTAQPRNIWEIRKNQEAESNQLDIALFHRKPPPFAGIHKPLGFKLIFEEDKLEIKSSDPKRIPEFSDQLTTVEQTKLCLEEGPKTAKIISGETGITLNTVTQNLKRLAKRDEVTKLEDDTWGLCYQGDN